MTIDLVGTYALVTGAGGGIGEACARSLAKAGAYVFVNDLDPEAAVRVAEAVGGKALPGDVCESEAWVGAVLERPLHTLIHCAGFDSVTPVEQGATVTFDRLMDTFLRGPFDLTSKLLPALTNAGRSSVTFVSSVQGFQTYPEQAGYAGSKAGQVGMVKAMALELGPLGIRVNAISPGYVRTRLMEAWAEAAADPAATMAAADAMHPLGRMGQPSDIAHMVTFLASPFSEFVNGTNIVVDGGLAAKYP